MKVVSDEAGLGDAFCTIFNSASAPCMANSMAACPLKTARSIHEASLRVLPLSHWLSKRDDEGGHLEQAEGHTSKMKGH